MSTLAEIPVTQGSHAGWNVETSDFVVRELLFDGGVTLPSHRHEFACLSIVASGSMEKTFRSHRYELESPSLISIPREDLHSVWFGRHDRHPMAEVDGDLVDQVVEQRDRHIEGFAWTG